MRFFGGLRAAFFICGATSAILTLAVACSDDENLSAAGTGDAAADNVNPNPTVPPPSFPDAPAPPPDLVSRSTLMGNATLVVDVGEPTDGPAWRNDDGALYFTVPSSPNPLRRVVPGSGTASIVAVDAGAGAALGAIGVATGGGSKLFVSERESIVTLDVDDAGAVTSFARTTGPGGTHLTDIAAAPPEPVSYVVDVGKPGVYQFIPPSTLGLRINMPDAGRTTAIHVRKTFTQDLEIYVGASGTNQGDAIVIFRDTGSGLALSDQIPTGIPINGLAVDDSENYFVAWAKGISVSNGGSSVPQDGNAALPIAAIPTNLTFGGADGKTLFVTTAQGKIYSIAVQTKGQSR